MRNRRLVQNSVPARHLIHRQPDSATTFSQFAVASAFQKQSPGTHAKTYSILLFLCRDASETLRTPAFWCGRWQDIAGRFSPSHFVQKIVIYACAVG